MDNSIQLFIPPITTALTLAEPWHFTLYDEYRNEKFITNLRKAGFNLPNDKRASYGQAIPLCRLNLPAGTVLKVARIYIRVGLKDFDSVTFNVNFTALVLNNQTDHLDKKKVTGRVWARLSEVNTMRVSTVTAGWTPAAPKVETTVKVDGDIPVVTVVLVTRKFNFA